MNNGQWVRFKASVEIPDAHSVDGWFVGVWYGPNPTVAVNANKIIAVDSNGWPMASGKEPPEHHYVCVPIASASEIHACTDPNDIPAGRRAKMGPVSQWIPRWPELESVDG